MIFPELLPIVLRHLQADARSSIRLLRAVRDLYVSQRENGQYWKQLELGLFHVPQYQIFRKYVGHLGVRRRLLLWTGFCDAPCFSCRTPLFGICCGTFAVGRKFCSGCRYREMVSEVELSRRVPLAWIVDMRKGLRHAWLDSLHGSKQRYFLRAHVNGYIRGLRCPIAISF